MTVNALLLTGATGLVGRFLLAGLLRRHIPVVAFVRPQAFRSVRERIDQCLAPFESHCQLPRPIVFEADFAKPGLGLSSDARQWLEKRPIRVLHSAASIRFQAEHPDGEPYATNVRGTQMLIEAAQRWKVEQWHHVSTAYVQCDRYTFQTAYETPVHPQAQAGNDYERSKIRAEEMVSQCEHIGVRTIYRPSIVVGHSQSGYTSTFHGFYAPLQIAAGLARTSGFDARAGDIFRERLGMSSSDSKNLVPVDWLAEAILALMENPRAHGGIYHLTHEKPTRLHSMQTAMLESLEAHFKQRQTAPPVSDDLLNPQLFREQMAVYDSYFQNDPGFDRTQAASFLDGKLSCPEMDKACLRRLSDFALKTNFGWPRPIPRLSPKRRLHSIASNPTVGKERWIDDCQLELEIIGNSDLTEQSGPVQIFRRSKLGWERLSRPCPNLSTIRLLTTEQSLLTCLTAKIEPDLLVEHGRWLIQGVRPANWLAIVSDWVQHLTIIDAESAAGKFQVQ